MFSDILLVTFANILVGICGLFREVVISGIYGTSITADHFLTSYLLIEEFNSKLFVGLIFGVSAYIKKIKNSDDVLKFLMKLLIYILPIAFFIFTLSFFFFEISQFFISEKIYNENFDSIMKYSSFSFSISIINSILATFLVFKSKYFIALFSKFVNYIFLIIFLLLNPNPYDGMYIGLLVSLAYTMQLVFLSFFMLNEKLSLKEVLHFKINIYEILKFSLPWMLQPMLMPFAGNIIGRYLVSGFDLGSISSINYASKILNAMNIFTFSVILIGFMDSLNLSKNIIKIKNTIRISLIRIIFSTIPITIFCCLYSQQIISIIFERGSFDSVSTQLTAGAFYIFALTLFPGVFYGYMSRIIGTIIGNKQLYILILLQFLSYVLFMFIFLNNFQSSVMPIGRLFSVVLSSFVIIFIFARKIIPVSIVLNFIQSIFLGLIFVVFNKILNLFSLNVFVELFISFLILLAIYGVFIFSNKDCKHAFTQ